jgi:secreted trypsin-like serine protease
VKKLIMTILTGAFMTTALFALGSGESVPEGPFSQITYKYIDSSVPPKYHRSYTISITAEAITVVVDSYGELVAKKIYPGSREILDQAGANLKKEGIRSGAKRRSKGGCTGGTGEAIGWDTADGKNFYATVYHCANQDEGTLYGDVAAFGSWCKTLVPDLGDLLKTPWDPELNQ